MEKLQLDLCMDYLLTAFDAATAVRLVRQVFSNKDVSSGKLPLAGSGLTCNDQAITPSTQKRWPVAVFHPSFKLKPLSLVNIFNRFALCRKRLINASRSAYDPLQMFRSAA